MKDLPDPQNFDEWIAADLLNDLTPEERKTFEFYLQENPEARSLHQQTTAMSHLLDASLAGARPGPNFENRLLQSFREQAESHPLRNLFALLSEKLGHSLRLPAVYIPATAILLVGLISLGSSITRPMESAQNKRLLKTAALKSSGGVYPSYVYRNSPLVDAPVTAPTANLVPTPPTACSSTKDIDIHDEYRDYRDIDYPVGAPALRRTVGQVGGFAAGASSYNETRSRVLFSDANRANDGSAASDKLAVAPKSSIRVVNDFIEFSSATANKSEAFSSQLVLQPNPAGQTPSDQGIVDGRKLVRDASLDLEVKNYDTALDAITAIAAGNSGYVATKNSARLPNGKMSGSVVIKVLPARLDDALLQIRALGELKNQSLSTRDVTKEYFDTDARLRNARKMEERLLALLDTMKGKITELLAVEKELARVREQIEEMQGELKVYDSLVQYATITISLREKDLNEAAAYLLQENVTLSLFSSTVEKTYETARREADDAKAQILSSRIDRDDSRRAMAVLSVLVAPEEADGLFDRLKLLGRVQNFNKEDHRVAKDGSGDSTTAKVERDKVQLNLSILQDDQSGKQVALTVITKDVESAFENAKSAASKQGGTLIGSNLQHPAEGGTSATLSVRVPDVNFLPLLETFKKSGLVSQYTIQRDDTRQGDGEKSPVLVLLTLTDADQPVQFTQAAVLVTDVETQASSIKKLAEKPGSQLEVKDSSFERTPDGRQTAMLVLRLPLENHQSLLDEIGRLGKIKDLSIHRQERTDKSAPSLATAEVTLRFYNQGNVVAEENSLWATLRKTLGEGTASLMWSVRMIGVAVAFLAPWILLLGLILWIVGKSRKKKSGASENPPENQDKS